MKSTYFNLLAEFGAGEIKLVDCCEKYFGMKPEEAKRRASFQQLPVPVHRATASQKGPWLVSAQDLAELIDRNKEASLKQFNAMKPLQVAG